MSSDRDLNVNLKVNPDAATIEATKKALKTVFVELEKTKKARLFDELTKDAIKFAKKTDEAGLAVKRLTKDLLKAGATADELEAASKQFAAGLTAPSPGQPGKGGKALVGAQAVGAGVGGQAGGAISSIAAGAATLGPVGAAAAAATVALSLATSKLTEANERARAEVRRNNELIRDSIALEKLTTAELQSEGDARRQNVQDIQDQIDAIEKSSDPLFQVGNDVDNLASNFEAALFGIGDTLGVVGAEGDEMDTALQQLKDDLATATGEVDNINTALDSTEVAANDAAAALEELNQQIADDLLEASDDAGAAIRAQTDAMGRNKEANLERLQQIENERKAILAQLEVLKSQGSESEDVARKIEQLTDQLGDLGQESEIVSNVANKQRDESTKSVKAHSVGLSDMSKALKDAKDKRRELIDAIEDNLNTIKDIEFKAAQDREKIAIDANREQEKLLRESKDQFNQDFMQDFLGEFLNRQQLAANLRETQIQAGQSFQDVNRQLGQDIAQQGSEFREQVSEIRNTNTFNFPGSDPRIMRAELQKLGIIGGR